MQHDRKPTAALSLFLCAALASSAAPADTTAVESFEQDGLRVEMQIEPLGGGERPVYGLENVRLRFRVGEAGRGANPITGLDPLSWLVGRDADAEIPDRDACEYQIRSLLAGRLARVADVNLNEYLLITLDDHASVSIIDPQIESSKTKTLGIVSLTAKGVDFVLAPDRRNILITLPEQGKVAAADIFIRKARYLEVGGRPFHIDLAPDGRLAWVGDETAKQVSAVDTETFKLAANFDVGPGPHLFAFDDDARFVYVTSPRATTLTVIDAYALEIVAGIEIDLGTVAIDHSGHTGRAYNAVSDGTIVVVDGESHEKTATISLAAGLSDFAVSPDGRFGFALHQNKNHLTIIDLATPSIVHEVDTGPLPDHLDFTETFLYVRHAGSGEVLLVDLAVLARGDTPSVAPTVMGQRPPASQEHGSHAPMTAALPEGGGVLALNTADRSIYHFMEGMNAPMGAYQTYPWPARGLLISDRTIREVQKGVYETEFRVPRAGVYTVPFLLTTSPKLWGCFTLTVNDRPGQVTVDDSVELQSLFSEKVLSSGKPQRLRIRLTEPDSGDPVNDLSDVTILVMNGPTWQWRGAARHLADGEYEVTVTFPSAGRYMVMAASPSRRLKFGRLRSVVARVE